MEVHTLGEKTLMYWEVCRSKSSDNMREMVTERALSVLSYVLRVTSPMRPLAKRTLELQGSIIIGDPNGGKRGGVS